MPKAENRGEIGAKRDDLSPKERDELNLSFERGLEDTRTLDTEVLLEKLEEYREEIQVAAEVARYELNGEFDGQQPQSGNFGIDRITPGYFGYDSWDDMPALTGGGVNDWLDSHSPSNLASGSGNNSFGDPLGIGEPAVHLVVGVQSYAPDPVVERVKFEKNDQPYAAISTIEEFRNTDLQIKWLDSPILLQPDDDFAARVYTGGEVGSSYEDALALAGVSYLEARKMRLLDPADMAGTADSDVVIER